jgi:hypothetical protein
MKFARRLREAVVRYVPAIEFYGLNGFGWSDDIFEPNPPPNEEFFKKNAMVLMEEMKDMDYATDSDSEDNDSDEIISGLVSVTLPGFKHIVVAEENLSPLRRVGVHEQQ